MRIADGLRKSVVFFGTLQNDRFVAGGTGFVGLLEKRADRRPSGPYLITVKHVAERMADANAALRYNTRDGASRVVRHPQITWFHRENEQRNGVSLYVDVSVAVWSL